MKSVVMVATIMLLGAAAEPAALAGEGPLVISHRGASGYLPEASVQAYQLAISMGSDFIEGDVYLTADKVAVMLHDGMLDATTDVAAYAAMHPEIAALRSGDGTYHVSNFTLAQLERLSLICRDANGYCTNRRHLEPGTRYTLVTYEGFLDLAYANFLNTGVAVGVFPEAKQPGLVVVDAILSGLHDPRYDGYFTVRGHALTQSFDAAQVAYLNANSPVPVSYLGVCPTTAAAAAAVAAMADGIGPSRSRISAACVEAAHQAGLTVIPYTYLDDPAHYASAYALGVDGVFTNHPDVALRIRGQMFPPVPAPAPAP